MKRKALAVFMVAAMAMTTFAGCGSKEAAPAEAKSEAAEAASEEAEASSETAEASGDVEAWTVGFTNRDDSDTYLKAVADYFAEYCDEDDTIEVLFADAANDPQAQLDQLDNFTIQGVNAVVLVPKDGDTVVDYVEQCNEDGIPVFCSSQAATGGDFTFVGASDYEMGVMTAAYAEQTVPEGAKIIYLGGDLGYQTSIDRRQGLVDAFGDRLKADWDGKEINKDGDVEVLTWQLCDYSMEDGMRIMEDCIQTFSDFDAVICCNDSTALGAIEALKGAGITDCKVYGIDAIDDAIAAVASGEMTGTVMQDAKLQAKALYDAIKTAQAGGTNPAVINPETVLINADNVADYQ